MKILHISDFHIDSPNNPNENLREGFYNEFIDNLFRQIEDNDLNNIDLVVNTGDFVNIGKVENFDHAKNIINYVLKKSNVSKDKVAVCVGNHDFKLDEESRSEKLGPFNSLSNEFQAGKLLGENDRCKLYKLNNQDSQVLIIDNVTRADKVNEPCELQTPEIDDIIKLVRENGSHSTNLIVVSHYPMMPFPLSKYTSEESNWTRDHVWKNGFIVQSRLASIRPKGECIFLCGDGHIPDAFKSGNTTFVMTGQLGGDYTKKSSTGKEGTKSYFIHTQVRIIDFADGEEVRVHTFNYKPIGFDYDVNTGSWHYENSTLREIIDKPKIPTVSRSSRTTVLSVPLQDEIMSRVKKEKLFKIGRFITSDHHHSLAWVSINRLFEEQQIMISLIDKGIGWLDGIINNKEQAIVVGVDFWGAMLGTHLAVRLGLKIVCLSNKILIEEDRKLTSENLKQNILGMSSLKDVIIVSDVVASGNSVLRLIGEIEESASSFHKSSFDFNYHSISVISDSEIERTEFDKKLTSVKTACATLRMPIVKSEQLPETDIFPSMIDFTN